MARVVVHVVVHDLRVQATVAPHAVQIQPLAALVDLVPVRLHSHVAVAEFSVEPHAPVVVVNLVVGHVVLASIPIRLVVLRVDPIRRVPAHSVSAHRHRVRPVAVRI